MVVSRADLYSQVVSPFQAILDYEIANGIPVGWINQAISRAGFNGAWHRIERGEIPLDEAFFDLFKADLEHASTWNDFCMRSGLGQRPAPTVDAKALFWNMMRMSRTADPYMYPALLKLKQSGNFVMGGLSNTVIFPREITDDLGAVFDKGLRRPENLSNPAWAALPQINRDISSVFDIFVSSAHVGLRKPDPKIYELALRELNSFSRKDGSSSGIRAEDVVFLDDIGQNLRAARKAGMQTLKVDLGETQRAVRELQRITGVALDESPTKANI
jgi:FMN phosphatase YigB (HAD superfamily)